MLNLPPDPDGINDTRAQWANECLQLMSDMTGCASGREALGDLVANLFHWGDRHGVPPAAMQALFASQFQLYREETGQPPERV